MNNLLTWEQAISTFSSSLSSNHLSQKTRREYIAIVKDVRSFVLAKFSLENPTQITSYHLVSFIREYTHIDFSSDLSLIRINRKKKALCLFFDQLVKQGEILENPSSDIRVHRIKKNHGFDNPFEIGNTRNQGLVPNKTNEDTAVPPAIKTVTAHEIKAHLDLKVVGQELAKVQISVLLSMHMNWFKYEEHMHRSPNAILIGPTGVGKTHTIRVASEYLKIPFITVDTTTLVPSGIAGLQVEDILGDLVREASTIIKQDGRRRYENDDIELARRGIIFFDEFDKINTGSNSRSYNESQNLSVQRSLLKLTDGSKKGVGVRGHIMAEEPRSIDTSGILVLAGGAFFGIDKNEIRTLRPVELQRELAKSNNVNTLVSADIISYGFMPELVARLPVIVEYKQLDETDLLNILNNEDVSPIQTWVEHFRLLNKELKFTDDAKNYAVKKAMILKMGARGLQQILFPTLARLAYSLESASGNVVTIDTEHLDNKVYA